MNYLNDFLLSLRENNLSESTISIAQYLLVKAKKYFEEKNVLNDSQVNTDLINEYLRYSDNRKRGTFFLRNSVIYLRKYYRFLEHLKIIFISPMNDIENIKQLVKPTTVISQEKLKEILKNIQPDTKSNIRLKLILELLYSSALRPKELINLKFSDINFADKTLLIKQTKTRKDRVVPVTDIALDLIKLYQKKVRKSLVKKTGLNYLILTHSRKINKLTPHNLYNIFLSVKKRFNLQSFYPYMLRSASATHLLNNGMSIFYIKELLGHVKLSTTQNYLKLKTNDLKSKILKHHPRNKF